jgi:replicative superfamily II helicase
MDYYSPYLNRNRARILFNAGFTTITKIAQTDPVEIYKTTKIPLEKIIEMVTLRGQPKPKNLELDNL